MALGIAFELTSYYVTTMSHTLTVLYHGVGLSGRSESLHCILPPRKGESTSSYQTRLAAGFDWTFGDLRILLRVCVFDAGSLDFESIHDPFVKTGREWEHLRECAERVWALLPDIDGVVFVVDSQWLRFQANVGCLENLERDLARRGRSLATLPVVFQLNKRDLLGASRVEEIEANLSTACCAYVDSVAYKGIGVRESLARLISMVRQPPVPRVHLEASPREAILTNPSAEVPMTPKPSTLDALFTRWVEPLTRDGLCRHVIEGGVSKYSIALSSGRFVFGKRYAEPAVEVTVPVGRYPLELVTRTVEYRCHESFIAESPETLVLRVSFEPGEVSRLVRIATKPQGSSIVVFGEPIDGLSEVLRRLNYRAWEEFKGG